MKSTAVACANIAFIKYWGRLDDELNLPLAPSLSMTVDALRTTTTVELDDDLKDDILVVNGVEQEGKPRWRAARFLDALRERSGQEARCRVTSKNEFPHGAGLASSASAFAALTKAGCAAMDLDVEPWEASALARLGSGSACRSMFGGFVEWLPGGRHEDSFARQVAPPEHLDLRDVVVVVEGAEKDVGSAEGHGVARTSPFLDARLAHLHESMSLAKAAILDSDVPTLGVVSEMDALSMHAVMMTSDPSLLYWAPETVRLLKEVRRWREEDLGAWVTLDAGPNPHILCAGEDEPVVRERLRKAGVKDAQVFSCRAGPEPKLVPKHLA